MVASVDDDLVGRTVVVTGVSRRAGIGFAIAQRLLAAGATVVVHSWTAHDREQEWGADPAGIDGVLDALGQHEGRAHPVELDLGEPDAPAALFAAAAERVGQVDALVANHARSSEQRLDQLTVDELDRAWAVNARASVMLVQAFAAQYDGRASGSGRIVLFTSGQHLGPMSSELPYAISKGAIHQMTLSLSDALADRGITVNAVNPGPTDTGWAPPDVHEHVGSRVPARPVDAAGGDRRGRRLAALPRRRDHHRPDHQRRVRLPPLTRTPCLRRGPRARRLGRMAFSTAPLDGSVPTGEGDRPGRLVEAARQLANETGSASFTVAQVALRAGLSLKSFYQCFPGKDDLLLALLAADSVIGAEILASYIGEHADPDDAMHAYVRELFALVTLPGATGYAGVLVREHRRLREHHSDEMQVALAPMVDLLAAYIARVLGARNPHDIREAQRDAATMFSLLLDGVHDVVVGRVVDAPELGEYLWAFCRNGLLRER